MDENAADRRTRRTRDRLRQALITMLLEKDIKDVTVSELAGMADVNRGTFYLHYRDVQDLFRQIEDELVNEFSRYIVKYKNRPALLRMPTLGELIQYIAMNEEVCRVLIRSPDSTFIARIIQLSRPGSRTEFRRYYKRWNEESCDYYFDFICYGSIAILRRWLESGMKESVAQISLLADRMIANCIENIKIENSK
ncbi:MAG: TetR/AcrR family transcriptional regulator [Treponema sp.]|jgi:AcrR family transcriptional regulator|nr:TetR/AcrR family transcriptional regulator [Treponema sp.]